MTEHPGTDQELYCERCEATTPVTFPVTPPLQHKDGCPVETHSVRPTQ